MRTTPTLIFCAYALLAALSAGTVSMLATQSGAMSGRDLRSFLSGHRKLAFDLTTRSKRDDLLHSYVTRATTSKRSMSYRPIDYDQLLETAQRAREEDRERLARVRELSRRGETSKERGLLRTHHEIWEKERVRLQEGRRELQEELEVWRSEMRETGERWWEELVAELVAMESELYSQRQEFFEKAVQPLWSLKAELKTALETRGREGGGGGGVGGGGREDKLALLRELEAVKKQQERIREVLEEEYDLVWTDLMQSGWGEGEEEEEEEEEEEGVQRDIPLELSEVEGVDLALHHSALRELQLLDDHYHGMLVQLRSHHTPQLSEKHGGWSQRDAELFHYIAGQYPASLMKRRTLLIDRLMRELPHKTRAQIVRHESWHSAVTFHRVQRSTLLKSWKQHRNELCFKLIAMLAESKRALESRTLTLAAREERRKKNEEMYQKVCVWRAEKMEAERRLVEQAAVQRREEEEERRRQEHRTAEHRERLKAKLEAYEALRSKEREQEREREEGRLQEARLLRERELRRGRRRVGYRSQLMEERQAQVQQARERAMAAVREREKRLEQLRQKVEVNATRDPLRVLKGTKASESRLLSSTNSELEAQHPLFPLHGYHDNTVTSDPRFRVAAALQKAGLLDSSYARKVLASIPPPQNPRPDQASSLFK